MTDMKIHPCYFCGSPAEVCDHYHIECEGENCNVYGPSGLSEEAAIEAWNSLASRLKPAPKVVTIKRWATVFLDGDDKYVSTGLFEEEVHARTFCDRRTYIDTVEVSITFTDSRGVV